MVCLTAVAVSVAVTLAPGTAAPTGSVMVPSKLPPSLAHRLQASREHRTYLPLAGTSITQWGKRAEIALKRCRRWRKITNQLSISDFFGPILKKCIVAVNQKQQVICN